MNVFNETPANGPGLRDVFAAAGKIGLQALKQPALVLEQEGRRSSASSSRRSVQSRNRIRPRLTKRCRPGLADQPFYRGLLQG
jgi:hypothetical protein